MGLNEGEERKMKAAEPVRLYGALLRPILKHKGACYALF